MQLSSILDELITRRIRLKAHNGELKIHGAKEDLTPDILDRIRGNKDALLEYLRVIQREKQLFSDIPVAVIAAHYPLSSAQRRIWVLSQLEEASVAYNRAGVFLLEGHFHPEVLPLCFASLIGRHESLRTVFKENEEGEIRQFILSAAESGFHVENIDLRERPDWRMELDGVIEKGYAQPFDLSAGPLLRASLCRIEEEKWVLTYVMHHIISDGWSMVVLIRELLLFYRAYVRGAQEPLTPLVIQYKDYSVWQQAQMRQGSLYHQRAYWLDRLQGPLPILPLCADKPRPPMRTYKGGLVTKEFSVDVTQRLKQICKEQEVTLFMSLLAAVNAVLYRYCGAEDIIVGYPVAGREHGDLQEQIGFYVNTLVARTRFQGGDSFRQLLEIVRRGTMEAYAHQDYPFDELINDLNLRRDMSRNVLFDVMVALQDAAGSYGRELQDLEGLRVSAYEGKGSTGSKFDLLFTFKETGETVALAIEYNSDLYYPSTVERMGDHLIQLLGKMLDDPDAAIDGLDYLNSVEKQLLLETFDGGVGAYRSETTLTMLFEERVLISPDATALVAETKRLSYRELNEWVNRLGHYLRQRKGIGAADLVAVKLDRSEWMIIAILGILKAGAGYLPLDTDYPEERIAFMTADSGCVLVLDDEEMLQFKLISSQYDTSNLPVVNTAGDTAYVIYTSGTTGRPKGAIISHANIVSLLRPEQSMFEFDGRDVWTLFHSICFDFSVWEMYGALVNGGRLVIVSSLTARDPDALLDLLDRENVTILNQTPSAFYHLLGRDQRRGALKTPLRYVIFGGEALATGKLGVWKERYPSTKLINMYGITETTVHVTYREIGEVEIRMNSSVIGRPLPTLCCYVMDARFKPVPVGIEGELYVAGAGVSQGYLNREELTAQRFLDDPFRKGQKLYRTGDKVRRLENGELEYRGRIDAQVKVRGFRIEPAEIERMLEKHDGVVKAVVTVRKTGVEDKELVAYVVGRQSLSSSGLRNFLGELLPPYMLPSCYIQLDELPLTSNGKIDCAALPEPEGRVLKTGLDYTAPASDEESGVVAIWQKILGRDDIGVTENFFQVGGDSMKLIAMVNQVSRLAGENIPLVTAYKYPTIRQLAQFIYGKRNDVPVKEETEPRVDIMDETLKILE